MNLLGGLSFIGILFLFAGGFTGDVTYGVLGFGCLILSSFLHVVFCTSAGGGRRRGKYYDRGF